MKKASVLICDDEPGVRESLKLLLEGEYALAFATDGDEAVEYARTHDFDVALLDIKMPKMNGLEVARQIKKIRPGVKVLMISGYESSHVASQAIRAGADDYLNKPFDGRQVKAQIQALLHPKGA